MIYNIRFLKYNPMPCPVNFVKFQLRYIGADVFNHMFSYFSVCSSPYEYDLPLLPADQRIGFTVVPQRVMSEHG